MNIKATLKVLFRCFSQKIGDLWPFTSWDVTLAPCLVHNPHTSKIKKNTNFVMNVYLPEKHRGSERLVNLFLFSPWSLHWCLTLKAGNHHHFRGTAPVA